MEQSVCGTGVLDCSAEHATGNVTYTGSFCGCTFASIFSGFVDVSLCFIPRGPRLLTKMFSAKSSLKRNFEDCEANGFSNCPSEAKVRKTSHHSKNESVFSLANGENDDNEGFSGERCPVSFSDQVILQS